MNIRKSTHTALTDRSPLPPFIRCPGRRGIRLDRPWRPLLLLAGLVLMGGPSCCRGEEGTDRLTFDKDILPIFRSKCIRCHAGVEPKADLNLTQPSALLTGGKSGAAIRIRAAEFSLLYEKVSSDQMPPVGQKLTPREKGLIRRWINDGAAGVTSSDSIEDESETTHIEHWSFNPPRRPPIPAVEQLDRVRNPIDAFILDRLEAERLSLSADAAPLTLLRRASFDLTGLPPDPRQIELLLSDTAPGWYERMIDRLLASPAYGERWARHWLDVAGYTESAGILNEDKPLPLAWRYRDYVVRAFNRDTPYDRFLQEQLAGDELTDYWKAFETEQQLPPEVIEGITATGYLRTAADPSRPDFASIKNAQAQYYYPTMFDTLQIVGTSTMGLTLQCARCHSHKFDPITQVDYYRLQAIFRTAYRPEQWIPQMNRRLDIATKAEQAAATQRNAEIDAKVKSLQARLSSLRSEHGQKLFEKEVNQLPEEIRADVKSALDTDEGQRNEVQRYLVERFQGRLRPPAAELEKRLLAIPDFKSAAEQIQSAIAAEERQRVRFEQVRALYDQPGPAEAHLLLRGDPLTPGPQVQPGVIQALRTAVPFKLPADSDESPTSGRRLAFARWLTQPDHPLTARVMVNRVWMHHFGRGLVATADDFGIAGEPPSHPELLDWLAVEFVESGWSVKQLHRLILTSSTWRQQSRVSSSQRELAGTVDPDNRLLWRQTMRRLEAEPIRDTLLSVAGRLTSRMYGPSDSVKRQRSGEVTLAQNTDRRSLYIQVLRLNPESLLEAFDQPSISVNCTTRDVSTVSTQALLMLNSDQVSEAAEAFSRRVLMEAPQTPARHAMTLAFGRPGTPDEQQLLVDFLEAQTEHHLNQLADGSKQADTARQKAVTDLCHMLLSANEFLYID